MTILTTEGKTMRVKALTKTEEKVILLLWDGGLTGVELAHSLWPNSPGWFRRSDNNNAGMSRPAKAILHRLMKRGYVTCDSRGLTQNRKYTLTGIGRDMAATISQENYNSHD